MDKRQKNILVWVLTWAGLLLAVLYSPFGSPELYGPKQFYIANQGVEYNSVSIPYSSRIDNTSKIDIKNNKKRYIGGGYSGSSDNSLLDYNIIGGSKKFISNSSSFSSGGNNFIASPVSAYSHQESSSANNGGGSGGELYSYSGRSSKNKGINNQSPGLVSLSTDLSLISNNTITKQTATSGLDGTTDPGGDPVGDPIPVGEGWLVLLCFAAGYGIWKFKFGQAIS